MRVGQHASDASSSSWRTPVGNRPGERGLGQFGGRRRPRPPAVAFPATERPRAESQECSPAPCASSASEPRRGQNQRDAPSRHAGTAAGRLAGPASGDTDAARNKWIVAKAIARLVPARRRKRSRRA